MKFAFLAHPLSQEHRALLNVDDAGSLRRRWGGDLFQFCQQLHQNLNAALANPPADDDSFRVVDQFAGLVSASGSSCEGRFYEIPLDAAQILDQPNRAIEIMERAVDDAAKWGAEIIGLGSMTGIVGGQGEHLATRGPVAITTGNSLTVYSALNNLQRACEVTGIDLQDETVAVIGIPGSIGSALAKLIAPRCKKLICVARTASSRALQLADSLNGILSTNIQEALESANIVLSATSTGDCIDQYWLLPGSIVIDVAVPTDVIGGRTLRNDILVLTGGMVMTPETISRESMFIGFNHGMIPSCFGETMLLAFENRPECFSIGRKLSIEKIMEIGTIALKHGYDFSHLSSFGVPVENRQISRFKKVVYRTKMERGTGGTRSRLTSESKGAPLMDIPSSESNSNGRFQNGQLSQGHFPRTESSNGKLHSPGDRPITGSIDSRPSDAAFDQFQRYINPVLAALGKRSGFLKTFVKGEGCYLWDNQDRQYLDFVSGFGSLNLGHNHPVVIAAIQQALLSGAPGFAQSAVNPYAAELADRLVSCSPAGLEMVTFTNSGTESIEAAIKLVRAASSRKRILYCNHSYHGKTLGSLSLTGNRKFQEPFGPLVDQMDSVEFGDADLLARELETGRYAAFFVEPIQCEGGMNVPPPDYLHDVESLCRQNGTLFVLDEVQTGIGRTGKLFCADHPGVSPDIMAIAKSLGGGLIPCGAMLCREDLWMKAYGSIDKFALHSSTFAGGSLAMVAGLATLEVLEQSDLLENCRLRSEQLLEGLLQFARSCDLVKEVRGLGLLIGVEFNPLPGNIVRHFAAHDPTGVSHFLAPNALDAVRNLAPIYVMQTLLDEFGIYTQIARSKPSVLRIQPPLCINQNQIVQFLESFASSCEELSFSNRITDSMIAKSTVGKLEK